MYRLKENNIDNGGKNEDGVPHLLPNHIVSSSWMITINTKKIDQSQLLWIFISIFNYIWLFWVALE